RSGDRKDEMGLDQQSRFWGTPTSRDWKDGSSADTAPTNGLLGRQVIQNWPTPRAEERNQYNSADNGVALSRAATQNFPSSPLAPEQPDSGRTCWCGTLNCDRQSHKRRLNAYFVEWLQGLPLNWTSKTARIDSEALEIWLSRCRRRLLSLCLLEGQE
ncbi:MAG: hypothetical protein KGL39_55895, partial [Patescibacteria group bacterium]|nr:hypothetical protein [Patescibacteria group bacterium]